MITPGVAPSALRSSLNLGLFYDNPFGIYLPGMCFPRDSSPVVLYGLLLGYQPSGMNDAWKPEANAEDNIDNQILTCAVL